MKALTPYETLTGIYLLQLCLHADKRWSATVPHTDPPESLHSGRSAHASSFVFEPGSLYPTTPSALSSINTLEPEDPPHNTPAVTLVVEPDSAAPHSYHMQQQQHQQEEEEEEEEEDEVFQSSPFQYSPVHKPEESSRNSIIVIPPPEYEILASREEKLSAEANEKARRRVSSFPDNVEDILEELHISENK